jgi:hypothetical protein
MEKRKNLSKEELLKKKATEEKSKLLLGKLREIRDAVKQGKVIDVEMDISVLAVEIDRIFNERKLKTLVKELKIDTEEKEMKGVLKAIKDLSITDAITVLHYFSEVLSSNTKKYNKDVTVDNLNINLE